MVYNLLISRLVNMENNHTYSRLAALLFVVRNDVTEDCLYGLVVRVPGYSSRCPDSIPGATRFSEK
jgi:hypothetical protein